MGRTRSGVARRLGRTLQKEIHSRADRLNIALISFAPVAPRLQYSKKTAAMSSKFLCSRSKAWRCQKKKPASSGRREAAVGGGPGVIGVFQARKGTVEIVQLYPLPQRQKGLVALLGLICAEHEKGTVSRMRLTPTRWADSSVRSSRCESRVASKPLPSRAGTTIGLSQPSGRRRSPTPGNSRGDLGTFLVLKLVPGVLHSKCSGHI